MTKTAVPLVCAARRAVRACRHRLPARWRALSWRSLHPVPDACRCVGVCCRLAADAAAAAPRELTQEIVRLKGAAAAQKEATLLALCSKSFREGRTIIFAKTKQRAHRWVRPRVGACSQACSPALPLPARDGVGTPAQVAALSCPYCMNQHLASCCVLQAGNAVGRAVRPS